MADQDQDRDEESKKRKLVTDECADSEAPPPAKKPRVDEDSLIPLTVRMEMLLHTLKGLQKKGVRIPNIQFSSEFVCVFDDPSVDIKKPKLTWTASNLSDFPTHFKKPLKVSLDGVFELTLDLRTWDEVLNTFEDILLRLKSENFRPAESVSHKNLLKNLTVVFDQVEIRLGQIQRFDHRPEHNNEVLRKLIDQILQLHEYAFRHGIILGPVSVLNPQSVGEPPLYPYSPPYYPSYDPTPSSYDPTPSSYHPTTPCGHYHECGCDRD
jgi:hypothetical protein